MNLARHVAEWSKDRSTKVGAVIVGPSNEVRAIGYNGFPRGVDDDVPDRHERPEKYFWVEHAERNAIYNAARAGIPLAGCKLYLPWFPCMDCARAIVQSGIETLIAIEPDIRDPKWGEDFKRAISLFKEAHVAVHWFVDGEGISQIGATHGTAR
jgi:dCMP deaminase